MVRRPAPIRTDAAPLGLEARIAEMEKMATGSAGTADEKEARLNALGEIRQIIGNLDKIQSTKVDAVRRPSAPTRAATRRRRCAPRSCTRARQTPRRVSYYFTGAPPHARGARRRTRGRASTSASTRTCARAPRRSTTP